MSTAPSTLLAKIETGRLEDLSDYELQTWARVIGAPTVDRNIGTPKGRFAHLAHLGTAQELQRRADPRLRGNVLIGMVPWSLRQLGQRGDGKATTPSAYAAADSSSLDDC